MSLEFRERLHWRFLKEGGCRESRMGHFQECMAQHQDWRQCQPQVQAFRDCMSEQQARRRLECNPEIPAFPGEEN